MIDGFHGVSKMNDCKRIEKNRERCTCTYPGCPRHAVCCECLEYHWSKKQVPGCMFPPEAETTWDRSLSNFIRVWQAKGF